MRIALTRGVSDAIGRCELKHLERRPISAAKATAQHGAYERALTDLGCSVRRLPSDPNLPDCVFIEDTALVLDELAVITRPGAPPRRPETDAVAQTLGDFRKLVHIREPAVLDGGDVLCVGRTLFVGLSSRSNREAVRQLRDLLARPGYRVEEVEVKGCLHLKSAATQVAQGLLLVNPAWVDPLVFGALQHVEVDPSEPHGANALLIGGTVIYPAAFPRTRQRLEERGIPVLPVDVSELAKAEGAVTCCSLVFSNMSDPLDL